MRLDEKKRRPISSEMMAAIKRFESRNEVVNLSIMGIAIWPLLRVRWFFSEWSRLYTKNQRKDVSKCRHSFKKLRSLIPKLMDFRLIAPIQCERHHKSDILFFSDGISFVRVGDKWWDRFCDPIALQAQSMGLISAFWSPNYVYRSIKAGEVWIAQPFIVFYSLISELISRISKAQNGVKEILLGLAEGAKLYGYAPSQFLERKALADAYRVNFLERVYRRRLNQVRPSLAFIVSFYSLEGMSFVLACKNLGIPVVDIQHGVQGSLHPAYAGWEDSMQCSGAIRLLPDCFWVWSSVESAVIKQWSEKSRHKVYVGGDPWRDLWIDPMKMTSEMNELVRRGNNLLQKAQGKRVVLVTLQYGLNLGEQLSPIKRLIELAGDDYKFWIRLHPMMLDLQEEVSKILRSKDIELDEVTCLPLPVVLPLSDMHVTHSSSVVIEASDFGIPSVISSRYGAEFFPEQLLSGMALEASDGAHDVLEKMRLIEKAKGKKVCDVERTQMPLQGLLELLEIDQSKVAV